MYEKNMFMLRIITTQLEGQTLYCRPPLDSLEDYCFDIVQIPKTRKKIPQPYYCTEQIQFEFNYKYEQNDI